MKRTIFISYLISHISYLPVAAFAATVQPVELPPFTFAGRIANYAHVAYDADTVVEVRVKAKDGTLLAKSTTTTFDGAVFNYAVNVPVATEAVSRHVKAGETVDFEFVDPDGRVYAGIVSAGDATIGKIGDYRRVDVILGTDANGDGVPDEYVETLGYLMWKNGKSTYDADADWDGDGQNNKAEYIAGTNPFDKTDSFSVRAMAEKEGYEDYISLKILVSQGRSYSVLTTGKLGQDVTEWTVGTFSVADPTASLQTRLTTGSSEMGYRILYVKKDGASRFWQLTVE